ncbi:MAG: LysR family transcriptional regulator [Lachnospiraceae bacterium]|nr:LysR family transcriptional regulator [Lachnospiraceae bacterium]
MELRVLKYFLTVAREENITKAAELLHITQPTLSRQLMQLEEELGTKLLKRGKHNVYLTEDGMLLKKRAQDIVTLADRTEREFTERQEEIAGEIVFGSAETMSVYELAKIIAEFQKEYPLVQYEMYTAIADDIKERMDKGIVDIGLLTEPVDISKYNFIRLDRKERWGVLVRNDSKLAEKEYVTPEDLANVPLLMAKREMVRNELSNWFGGYYDNLKIAGTYNLLNNAAVMVENGIGVALCFKISHDYEHLSFVPFAPALETGCVLVWQKNRPLSKAATVFLDIAKKYIKGIS